MAETGNWIRTDEAEDVAASVRHVLRCWSLIPDDPQIWKWIALALHSALQGACVCHLVTTASPVGAVTDRNAGEWLAYFEGSRTDPQARMPKTYLMALPALIKAVRKQDSSGGGYASAAIEISQSELRWLSRFHDELRNQFVHFEPCGWSIEVSGMPDLAKLVSRIVSEILVVGWAFRTKSETWKDALRADLAVLAALT